MLVLVVSLVSDFVLEALLLEGLTSSVALDDVLLRVVAEDGVAELLLFAAGLAEELDVAELLAAGVGGFAVALAEAAGDAVAVAAGVALALGVILAAAVALGAPEAKGEAPGLMVAPAAGVADAAAFVEAPWLV